jgi:hypothetical protein
MNLTEITDKIQEKLGKEESGKIADDLANILIFEESNNKTLKEKEDKINGLNKDKEMLIQANGNLLLQIPQSKEDSFEERGKEEQEKPFDFRSVFDEKGKFKR